MRAFDHLVEKQLVANMDGIVLLGTTGESPTIDEEEFKSVLCRARDLVGKSLVVIAGVSGNNTLSTMRQAKIAEIMGVDGILVTCPHYNKPSQQGLILHYRAVAEAVKTPILLYNIKGRTGVNIEVETTLQLAKVPNIVGIKYKRSKQ